MVLWGGLRPIVSQLVADVIALSASLITITSKPNLGNALLSVIGLILTMIVSGNMTNRWTIVFPMIPLTALQLMRTWIHISSGGYSSKTKWISRLISFLSLLLLLAAAGLSLLFPAVDLAKIEFQDGDFNVGIVDLHLPVDFEFHNPIPGTESFLPYSRHDHATVRILYPTLDTSQSIPYLRPETSEAYCEENMKHSAPPPLRRYHWMIHNWRLIRIQGKHHAKPAQKLSNSHRHHLRLPLIFFSHGLGGSAEMYAYQTVSLAAKGYMVIAIDHTDGSAPVVSRRDGRVLRRNETVLQLWMGGRRDEYTSVRRAWTAYRAQELLAVVDSIVALNESNLDELQVVGLDFRGLLNTNEIHYFGHSFGGATALHAAVERPPTSVVAHDPATDWMPLSSRHSLFDLTRLKGSTVNHSYWTGVDSESTAAATSSSSSSIHNESDLLLLFSNEWHHKNWSGVEIFEDMHRRKVLGPEGGLSHFEVIDQAHHQEFSDVCMITPLWLAREVGLTGTRNPLETAKEIHEVTSKFLESVRSS